MRRSTATALGVVVVAATVGVGTTAAIGAAGGSPSARSQAGHIASSLTSAAARAHYGLDTGRLVSADVCVRGTCVHRVYASAPVCAQGSACIGTALVVRRFAHGVTISAELA
ncbi:MAG: hypothetical protein ACJ735_00950 [Actinomycetes bacterium]